VPIITFVNKLDREGRDPFDLLDEIEQSLALDVTPASWPFGIGRDFLGTYDLFADALLLFHCGAGEQIRWHSANPADAAALQSIGGTRALHSQSCPSSFREQDREPDRWAALYPSRWDVPWRGHHG
jgi:peptide subunit release factor RF-3